MLYKLRKTVQEHIDCIIIFIIFLILHSFMRFISWDDPYYLSELKRWDYKLLELVKSLYMIWSARSIIEMTAFTFGALPTFIWKIFDSCAIVCFYLLIKKLIEEYMGKFEYREKKMIFTMLIFLCWPFSTMGTTGWLSSTIFTLWTFLGVLYTALILHRIVYGNKKISLIAKIIGVMGLTYSANHEITYSVYFFLFIIMTYGSLKNKCRGLIEIMMAWGIFFVNVLWALLSPGSMTRLTGNENKTGYLSVSILGKIRMGINTTFYHYVSVPNAILFILCLLIFFLTLKNTKSTFGRLCGTLPLIVDVLWTGYMFFSYTLKRKTLTYIYPDENFLECGAAEQYIAIFSALFLIALIIYNIQTLLNNKKHVYFLALSLLLGLLPEIELGFTPAISASILRVAIFPYASFLILILGLLHEKAHALAKWQSILLYICAAAGSIMNILQVIRHMYLYG